MIKNGFTLIELLAVIVILAIIAVKAVPIVINIIDESNESSGLRSAEMYLDAAELSIANRVMNYGEIPNQTYKIMSNGNICLGDHSIEEGTEKCNGNPEIDNKNNKDVLVIEVKGETPKEGTITINNGEILHSKIKISEKEIVKNNKGEIAYAKTLAEVCKPVEGTEYNKTAGAKYTCEVKEGTSYTFYVLTTPQSSDTSINLIMDRNICEDGTVTDTNKEDKCLVAYNILGDAKGKGPETAMAYLNNATSTWDNIDNLNIEYDDEGGHFTDFVLNGKARMPYYSEVGNSNGTNEYLYGNLDGSKWAGFEEKQPTNNISNIIGYWTLSSNDVYSIVASVVSYSGFVSSCYVGDSRIGVRPVINLKI